MTTPAGFPSVAVNLQQDSLAGANNIISFDGTTKFDNTHHFAPPYWGVDQAGLWRSVSILRGSSDPTNPMFHANTGTASVVLDNRTRKYDPISNTDARPGIGLAITATWSATTYPLYAGFVGKWPTSYAQRGSDSTVAIQANDAQEQFNNTTITDPLPAERTSTRVKRLLNRCNWPASLRSIGVGQSTMNATTNTSNNAWSAFLECADSEMGELYVDASGNVVFRDRLSITTDSRSITSQATFGDGGGSEIPFSDVTISNDLARIRNDIQVTFNESNGVAHASDRKSQLTYGGVGGTPRTYTITVSLPSQRAANAMANYLLFLYKDQQTTIDQIVLKPASAPTHWPDVLGRELGDRITVKLTTPGGGSRISRDCIIRGIKHDLSNNDWTTTWTLQDTYAFDSSKFIKFDGTTKFDGTKTWWY